MAADAAMKRPQLGTAAVVVASMMGLMPVAVPVATAITAITAVVL